MVPWRVLRAYLKIPTAGGEISVAVNHIIQNL
jgi:hypothetical protein